MGNVQNMFTGAKCSGSTKIGFLGAVDGVFAMAGLSGKNNPFFNMDDFENSDDITSMQQKIQDEMRLTENTLGEVIAKVTTKEFEATSWSLNNLKAQQKVVDLKQDEKIEKNFILIAGLAASTVILFVYDVIA